MSFLLRDILHRPYRLLSLSLIGLHRFFHVFYAARWSSAETCSTSDLTGEPEDRRDPEKAKKPSKEPQVHGPYWCQGGVSFICKPGETRNIVIQIHAPTQIRIAMTKLRKIEKSLKNLGVQNRTLIGRLMYRLQDLSPRLLREMLFELRFVASSYSGLF